MHAELLYNSALTDSRLAARMTVGTSRYEHAVRYQNDTLDAHTAAIRGLFASYLATGDTKYRVRAIAVYQRMEAVFYDPSNT